MKYASGVPSGAGLEIVETPAFARSCRGVLTEEEVAEIKQDLALRPNAGVPVSEGGGVRKLKCAASGRGKRGGARVMYVYFADRRRIYLLFAFKKSQQEDLARDQLHALAKVAKELKRQ